MLNLDSLRFDSSGLITCVIQDAVTGKVLMLGYANKETLEETISGGLMVFYSRSRNQRWLKGESSGNTLRVLDIAQDCDSDALLVSVEPAGPTCHTGSESCFEVEN
ncbi:MAG: phosphoribosyl-AMP cyclohydrolase [Aquiluna sp.]